MVTGNLLSVTPVSTSGTELFLQTSCASDPSRARAGARPLFSCFGPSQQLRPADWGSKLKKCPITDFLLLSSRMSLLWVEMGEGLRPLSFLGW